MFIFQIIEAVLNAMVEIVLELFPVFMQIKSWPKVVLSSVIGIPPIALTILIIIIKLVWKRK